VRSSRTVPKPSDRSSQHRLERWRTIAREAAQLAGRATVPVIHPLSTLEEACSALARDAVLIATAVDAEIPMARAQIAVERPLAIAIGPEGGFDGAELATLRQHGATLVHLGPRVLPARLAGVVALALALSRAGDLDAAAVPPPKI
jgi:16S rRNA (uracil1498-N3)-methyltransferase